MHIEKISDNQIKCTLSQSDLQMRHLNLSELAYGTDKARSLFQEMIEQAHDEFGFEADNAPIMVEAIPLSMENLVLIITRVDNPEELDTRFSRFSSFDKEDKANIEPKRATGADDILEQYYRDTEGLSDADLSDEASLIDSFKEFQQHIRELVGSRTTGSEKSDSVNTDTPTNGETPRSKVPVNLMRIYSFDDLDTLTELARVLHPMYNGVNSLYKNPEDNVYYLAVYQSHHSPEDFNKTCNILSEYGKRVMGGTAAEAYYSEHYNCIVKQTALQRLSLF